MGLESNTNLAEALAKVLVTPWFTASTKIDETLDKTKCQELPSARDVRGYSQGVWTQFVEKNTSVIAQQQSQGQEQKLSNHRCKRTILVHSGHSVVYLATFARICRGSF